MLQGAGEGFRRIQTGRVQTYLVYVSASVLVLVLVYRCPVSGLIEPPRGAPRMGEHILSWMTFFPVIGAAVIAFIPSERKEIIKTVAAAAAAVPLILAVQLFIDFDRGTSAFQFVEHYTWIKSFNIEYFMGIDGLSVPMVLLTALLSFLCVIASWNIEKAVKGYFALFLLLEAGMMGVFCALDFFLFYVFWEVMLLPMYFLIGIWGGPRREYAAIKFFLYTLAGSVLMLLAMIAFYLNVQRSGHRRPHLQHAAHVRPGQPQRLAAADEHPPPALDRAVHRLRHQGADLPVPHLVPDAHVEAPTAVSVILAGVLLKMGTYGILRISYPMLPDQALWFSLCPGHPGGDQHPLRRLLRHGPDGHEEARGLFFGQPHGLRAAGHVRRFTEAGHQRRRASRCSTTAPSRP